MKSKFRDMLPAYALFLLGGIEFALGCWEMYRAMNPHH